MNVEALKKVFPEGSEISINLPVTLCVRGYDCGDEESFIYLDATINRSNLDPAVEEDSSFVDDITIHLDTAIYPKSFLALIGKEANKVKTQLKKELQAQIKKLQDELDSL